MWRTQCADKVLGNSEITLLGKTIDSRHSHLALIQKIISAGNSECAKMCSLCESREFTFVAGYPGFSKCLVHARNSGSVD